MSYTVLVTERAEEELHQAADWIALDSPATANRWFNGFVEALLSLAENPQRCSLTRESKDSPFELRQLFYGRKRSYRAVFTIRDDEVVILRSGILPNVSSRPTTSDLERVISDRIGDRSISRNPGLRQGGCVMIFKLWQFRRSVDHNRFSWIIEFTLSSLAEADCQSNLGLDT